MCGCFAASALCIWRCFTIGKLEHQINEEIRDKELRVIGADGSQLGIMTSSDALALAEEKDLDLVKIAPNAVPPVCKIMDYGKFRFEQLKKENNMTIISIAHRLTTLKNCDNIIVMDHGQVVQSGKYQELISQEGIFSDMYYGKLK